MIFAAILPIAVWILSFLVLLCRGINWRIAFLAAAVLWGVCVTLLTELLSHFAALTVPSLTAAWAVLVIASGILVFRSWPPQKILPFPSLYRIDKFMLAAIFVILGCTFVIAVVSPPNNWDSLTYHMTRIMFWIEHGSVADFPTNNLRQIELNPWAEFAIMHLVMLSKGDYLANLVQWFSLTGCIVGGSLITGYFGGSWRGQLMTGFLIATVPMAILQASSTQNDLVVSFWLVCFIVFGINSERETALVWKALMSCSLGLAILTKGTAYVYAFPFVLWFFVQDIKKSWRTTAMKYLLLGSVVLSLNMGHYLRNFGLFHNPLQSGNDHYTNGRISAPVVASNVSRNAFLHLLTPSNTVNGLLLRGLNSFHNVLGIALDDSETTWSGTTPEKIRFGFHEDHSGNLLHLLLFAFGIVMLSRNRHARRIFPYALASMAGFLLFCAIFRWQPWASRLHLPLFIFFSPIGGVVVSEHLKTRNMLYLVSLLSLAALPYVVCNYSRPLIALPGCPPSIFSLSRCSLEYENKPERRANFRAVIKRIKMDKFKNIGLYSEGNSWEYPLWSLTHNNGQDGPRIEHMGVHNVSSNSHHKAFRPDAIVVITDDGNIMLTKVIP